jgi:hypothetical protein
VTRAEKATVREQWKARVAAYRASGLSAVEWCNANNLKTHRLWHWLREFESKERLTQECSQWLPIEVGGPSRRAESSLSIRIGRATITVSRGFDPDLLLDVVRALSPLC